MGIGYWGEYLGKRGTRSGENYIMKSLMICDPTKHYSGDEIEKNEMDRACSTNGEKRDLYGDLVGKPDVKKLIRKQGVVGRIILRWIYRKCNVRHELDRTGSR